jgi:hypothetical protein
VALKANIRQDGSNVTIEVDFSASCGGSQCNAENCGNASGADVNIEHHGESSVGIGFAVPAPAGNRRMNAEP